MPDEPLTIKRYPNRRFYARHSSQYVSLQDIERLISEGHSVEIRDSQTGEDLTRAVLTQIILERQPDKMSLFPKDMLHSILRSNELMTGFWRDYLRHSLTYLEYLQKHGAAAATMTEPVHWVKAWLERLQPATREPATQDELAASVAAEAELAGAAPRTDEAAELARRVEQLEARIRQLEGVADTSSDSREP
jgi:polyhydroxyalkanoate synthesis repressor PhaR